MIHPRVPIQHGAKLDGVSGKTAELLLCDRLDQTVHIGCAQTPHIKINITLCVLLLQYCCYYIINKHMCIFTPSPVAFVSHRAILWALKYRNDLAPLYNVLPRIFHNCSTSWSSHPARAFTGLLKTQLRKAWGALGLHYHPVQELEVFFTVLVPVRFLYLAISPQFRPLWFPQHYSLNAEEPNVPGSICSAQSGINERTTIAVFSLPPPQADSLVYLPVSWKTNSSFSWTLLILVATWLFHSFSNSFVRDFFFFPNFDI